jgi:ABC-type sugar transport system permease subunit
MSRRGKVNSPFNYLYLVPAFVLIAVFIAFPLADLFSTSLTKWDGLSAKTFTGASNYVKAFHTGAFWFSVQLTFKWVAMSVLILQTVGVILAVIVEYTVKSRAWSNLSRTIFFMPMMMSPVAIGLLWQLIYNPNLGLLTAALKGLGLVDPLSPPNFLGGSETALYAAFVPVIWNWGGFGMILSSAAILRIPADLYEAAAIDGADKAKQFFSITLPLLLPTIFLGMTINMIGAFKGFDLLYAMTGGGPANYTRLTSMYIYNVTFTENKFGYACAVSVILMAAVILFTIVFNCIGNRIDDKFTL